MIRENVVREYVLHSHGELLETLLVCADDVAASWDDTGTTDRQRVVGPFERALDREGVIDRLPAVLVGVVDVIDRTLPAEPVAAPPYLTMTAVGPVLRATLSDVRLVITVSAFGVERDPTRYVRGPTTPTEALTVEFKSR